MSNSLTLNMLLWEDVCVILTGVSCLKTISMNLLQFSTVIADHCLNKVLLFIIKHAYIYMYRHMCTVTHTRTHACTHARTHARTQAQ